MVMVYRYKRYVPEIGGFKPSTRMATRKAIYELNSSGHHDVRIIPGTGRDIDPRFLHDGWTEENFDPDAHDTD